MPQQGNQSPIQPPNPNDDAAKRQRDIVREAGKYRPGQDQGKEEGRQEGQQGEEAVDQARRDNADNREAGSKDPKKGQQPQRMNQRDENPIDDDEKGDLDPNDSIPVDGSNDGEDGIDIKTTRRSNNPAKPGQPVR